MEYLEEIEGRTENCLSLIYTARPHSVENNSKALFRSLGEHTGNPEILYFNATIDSPRTGESVLRLIFGLLEEKSEENLVFTIKLNIAVSLVCKDCHETHHYSLTPVTAKIDNEAKAYKLVADLNKVLGG